MVFPQTLLDQLYSLDQFDANAFIEAHQHAPNTSIRINPLKPYYNTALLEPIQWSQYGYYLPQRPEFVFDPLWHAGAYYVQEASSMFLEQTILQHLDINSVNKVLDLCAAPGGKSTHIASLLSPDSLLVSNEVIGTRANILVENTTKWGYGNHWVTQNDPKDWGRVSNFFDVLIIDAPCSGSGLFRKDKDAINEWSDNNVKLCAERQKRILHDALPCLKENGLLVYMTCSYSEQENEDICDYICSEFEVESLPIVLNPNWRIDEVVSTRHKARGYRFLPHKLKGEGFFMTCFKKMDSPSSIEKTKYSKLVSAQNMYTHWLQGDGFHFIEENNHVFAVQESHIPQFESLKRKVKILKKGIHIGENNFKNFTPSHELVMSGNWHKDLPCIDLSLSHALQYLAKKEIQMSDTHKGWKIITYQNCPLGWIKHLGNRINNYYPTNWRVRKQIDL